MGHILYEYIMAISSAYKVFCLTVTVKLMGVCAGPSTYLNGACNLPYGRMCSP